MNISEVPLIASTEPKKNISEDNQDAQNDENKAQTVNTFQKLSSAL